MKHFTELLPDPLPTEPLVVLNQWMAQSWQQRLQPNPNAMVLATSDPDGHPSARVVLCKEIVPQPGYLVFFTNYLSRKGRQLARNPRAAAVIHWDALHRQVRVEGPGRTGPGRGTATLISPPAPGRAGSAPGQASRALRSPRARRCRRPLPPPRNASAYRIRHRRQRQGPPTSRSRGPRTGAAITYGRTRWSCGSKVRHGFTTVPVGHAS